MRRSNALFFTVISLVLGGVLLVVYFGTVTTLFSSLQENSSSSSPSEVKTTIQKHLEKFPPPIQFSIGIVQDDQMRYFGMKRKKDTVRSVNNKQKVFEIGSITKVFTSALLAHQVVKGYMSLSDTISQYLPFSLAGSPPITLQQLANHTAGLPRLPRGLSGSNIKNPLNPYKNYSTADLIQYLQDSLRLDTIPGAQFNYSNLGAGVLELVLKKATSRSFEQLLQQHLLQPLHMERTTTVQDKVEKYLVQGYYRAESPAENWVFNALKGAGAILSSCQDMTQFMNYYMDTSHRVSQLQLQPTFVRTDSVKMALGWHIREKHSGARWYWHNGGTGGYRSCLVINPQQGTGVIVLSNISALHQHANKIDALCFELMELAEEGKIK